MSRSLWIRMLLIVGPVFLLWACGPSGGSAPPFPVESQSEWRRYLQGTWVYAGASPSAFGGGIQIEDSLFLRATFRGDSLDFVAESYQGGWESKRTATCTVGYEKPYKIDVPNCVRGLRLRLVDGDTAQADRFSVPSGSPRSKKAAFYVGSMFPPSLRAISADSLWMMKKGGTDFYLTRQSSPN